MTSYLFKKGNSLINNKQIKFLLSNIGSINLHLSAVMKDRKKNGYKLFVVPTDREVLIRNDA